eukprot:5171086-Pyramimonas_sp.AAC.1
MELGWFVGWFIGWQAKCSAGWLVRICAPWDVSAVLKGGGVRSLGPSQADVASPGCLSGRLCMNPRGCTLAPRAPR